MLEDPSEDSSTEKNADRTEKDRRSDSERRQVNQDPPDGEKRDQGGEDRRSWVARRQTADWRHQK